MTRPNEYHWVLGNFDHIEFPNGGDPVPAAPSQLSTREGMAVISDSSGALLMYTDGVSIWDGSLGVNSQIATSLGGHTSTTQSAIIVPPAGAGGTDYHVFAVGPDEYNPADKIMHSTYRPNSGTISQIIAPNPLSNVISNTFDNTERLAAISHADCSKYWVIFQDGQSADLHALLVESDAAPTTVVSSTSSLQQSGGTESGYMKFSPDGKMLAFADPNSANVTVLAFDNATGLFTDMHVITGVKQAYGIEFSPDSKTLYIASLAYDDVRSHVIANGQEIYTSMPIIFSGMYICALQIAPNDKIYGKPAFQTNLLEIGQPNTPLSPAVIANATYADGSVISLSPNPQSYPIRMGLPTFTRLSDACAALEPENLCSELAHKVDEALADQAEKFENMLPICNDAASGPVGTKECNAFELPNIQPGYQISWGASECDGLESDDVEVMILTICNPYSNVAFSNLVVHQMAVTLPDGTPVPELPDQSASVTLVPRGPQCFGDIAPCSCVSREFTIQTRGAKEGEYNIRLDGICFDVCLHQSDSTCFGMKICAD